MSQSQMVRNLSLGEYFLRRYQNVARPYTFSASNADEFETWKEAFGARLAEAMGPLPEACDLDPITLERVDAGSYWREKVLFNAEPDMAAKALFKRLRASILTRTALANCVPCRGGSRCGARRWRGGSSLGEPTDHAVTQCMDATDECG